MDTTVAVDRGRSGFVAGVLRALAAGVEVLIGFRGLVAGVRAAMSASVTVLVGLGRLGGDVVIIHVSHARCLPHRWTVETR